MTIVVTYEAFADAYTSGSRVSIVGLVKRAPKRAPKSCLPTNTMVQDHPCLPTGDPGPREKKAAKKHGAPKGGVGLAKGAFYARKVDWMVLKGGRGGMRVASLAGKTVHEYCPTAVMIEGGVRNCANTWQCRCC